MADEKVYTQEVISDNPLPNGESGTASDQTGSSSAVYTSKTIKDQPIARKIIAQETIGQALNTKSKKILGDFQFTESGAISIGKYTNGVSGDVKISPNGVVARNSSGNTTFALDGDTGNATFSGTIQAGDVTVMDEGGLVSLSNFSTSAASSASLNQSITTSDPNWTDITNSELNFSLERDTRVLMTSDITFYAIQGGSTRTISIIRMCVDGDRVGNPLLYENGYSQVTSSITRVGLLGRGDHTIKLQAVVNHDDGNPSLTIYSFTLYYLSFGS